MLASSSSATGWKSAYGSYADTIKTHSKSGKRRSNLVDLDDFVRIELPERVKTRFTDTGNSKNGFMNKEEVCKVVQWKITRGKFRPLMRYANALNPTEVETVTGEAFALASNDLTAALNRLISLKGIGPATASAILSSGCLDGSCPFLSDEAMTAFDIIGKGGKLEYTVASWEKLKSRCHAKVKELNEAEEGDEEEPWTAVMVERALWAEAIGKEV